MLIAKKLMCTIFLGVLLSSSTFALNIKSSNADLGSAVIPAGGRLHMSIEKLLPGISYKIICKVTNPSKSPTIISVGIARNILINGAVSTTNQATLAVGSNTIEGYPLLYNDMSGRFIEFINADFDTKIIIDNCTGIAL